MNVTIHHLNHKKIEDREFRLTITCDGNIGQMMIAMIEGKYDAVAEVNVDRHSSSALSIDDALEVAYSLTQNIESKWIHNEGVSATFDVLAAKGARSSSVGDIFEIDGKFYAAAGCGFEELTVAKSRREAEAARAAV